ncbi:MAG: C-GCAxxG-C-C family protein [Thermodesulfobacteriota bacterium]|nr:C-GCAxxG-C-C family protein [Thermodesulfobacteriota bacterium]
MAVPSLEELLERGRASAEKGNLCSQIVLDVGLDYLGELKADVVKAAGGLAGAQGFVEVTCGALTAAGVLIASAAIERMERDQMYMLIQELEERFNEDIAAPYPGNRCGDFLDADPNKLPTEVCPPIIAGATKIALELLEENGIGRH